MANTPVTTPGSNNARFLWAIPLLVSLASFGLLLAPSYDRFIPVGNESNLADLDPDDPILKASWLPPAVTYTPLTKMFENLVRSSVGGRPVLRTLDLLMHMGVSLLVYAVLRQLGMTRVLAALGASLFVVLSIHPDAVTRGIGRVHLLSALAVLGTWLLFLRLDRSEQSILLAFLSGVLVLLGLLVSPVVGMIVPLVLLSCWLLRRPVPWLGLAAAVSSAVGYWILRRAALGQVRFPVYYTENPLVAAEWHVRIVNGLALMGRYLLKIVAPVQLRADYSYPALPVLGFDDLLLWALAGGFVALAVFLVIHFRRRCPPVALAVLWFVLALLPFSSILYPAQSIFHERYAYLAAFAFPLAVCALAQAGSLASHRKIIVAVLAVMIVGYGVRTWARTWECGVPIVLRITEEAPDSARSHLAAADAYQALWVRSESEEEKDQLEKEVRARVKTSLEIDPEFPNPHLVLGVLLYNQRKHAEAVESFDRAMQKFENRRPFIVKRKLYRWRGECHLHLRNCEKALSDLDRYLELSESRATSPDAETFNLRGLAHALLSESQPYLEKLSSELSATDTSTSSMAAADPTPVSVEEARTHVLRKALRDFNTAIGLDETMPDFWNNRAYARFQLGDYEGAIRDYDKGLRIVRDQGIMYAPSGESVAAFLQRISDVYLEMAREAQQAGDNEKATEAGRRYVEIRQSAARLRAEWESEHKEP